MINYQPEPDIPFPWDPDDEDESINGGFFTGYLLE
jgi:hypothetical protein